MLTSCAVDWVPGRRISGCPPAKTDWPRSPHTRMKRYNPIAERIHPQKSPSPLCHFDAPFEPNTLDLNFQASHPTATKTNAMPALKASTRQPPRPDGPGPPPAPPGQLHPNREPVRPQPPARRPRDCSFHGAMLDNVVLIVPARRIARSARSRPPRSQSRHYGPNPCAPTQPASRP